MRIVNEGKGHPKEYMEGVEFSAQWSKYDNCLCNGCFRTGKALKITIPDTKYRKESGYKLGTKNTSLWLCNDCLDKLYYALDHAGQEE